MDKGLYHYFSTDYAIRQHEYIIEQSGGLKGVKNLGMIDSVLHHIQNQDYYPEFIDKIAHIVFGLNKNHAFNDGNKRASLVLSSFFLELNGHDFAVKQYTRGMEEVVIWVAKSLVEKDALKSIIEFLLYEDTDHVLYFIEQAKTYRPFIEPQGSPIQAELLNKMIDEWLSGDLCLSEQTLLELFDIISLNSED